MRRRNVLRTLCVMSFLVGAAAARAADDGKKDAEKTPPIRVGDTLEVTILDLQAPGVKTTVKPVVDKKGEVKLPHLARVAAKGLTCEQLEAAIRNAYRDANLLANADVSVQFAKAEKEPEGLLPFRPGD